MPEETANSRRLMRLQAASGLAFVLFLTLHLVTTSSAVTGRYDRVLSSLRMIYRPHIVVELLLIGVPALVHISCGLLRWLERRRRGAAHAGWRVRLQRLTGQLLLAIIFGHVFATRVMPALSHAPTATGSADLSFLAYSLLNWPWFMMPYYLIFGLTGAVHLCLGVATALQMLWPRRVRGAITRPIATAAAIILGFAVMGGVVAMVKIAPRTDTTRFPEFREVYEKYMPFMKPK